MYMAGGNNKRYNHLGKWLNTFLYELGIPFYEMWGNCASNPRTLGGWGRKVTNLSPTWAYLVSKFLKS